MYRVPLFDDETLTSYCSRLAVANATTATDFCKDMGFRFQDVIDGAENAIQELAEHGGIAIGRLRKSAIDRNLHTHWKVGAETFHTKWYSKARIRICPECFATDDKCIDRMPGTRRYIRNTWALRSLRTCQTHGCAIEDLGPSALSAPRIHDFIEAHDEIFDEVERCVRSPRKREFTNFERYILERLDGIRNHGNILDRLSLELGGYLCELIGLAAIHGKNFKLAEQNDDSLWAASQRGYSILAMGSGGLYEFLDEMHRLPSQSKRDHGGQALYGTFYVSLLERGDEELEFIKKEIHEYAFRTMPLTDTARVFGKSPLAKFIWLESLGKEHGINLSHLRKTAVLIGMINPDSSRSTIIAKADAKRLLETVNEAVLPVGGAKLIGVAYRVFLNLVNHGLIKPSLTGTSDVGYHARYSRSDLLDFIENVKPAAPIDDGENLVKIADAVKRLNCKYSEIVALLHSKTLKNVAWDDEEVGLAGIKLDIEEAARYVHLPDHGHFSIHNLAKEWGVSSKTVAALVRGGHLPSVVEVNVKKRRQQCFVTKRDAANFETSFVLFSAVLNQFDFSRQRLYEIFAGQGLSPVFPPDEVRGQFYRRVEVIAAIDAYMARRQN